MRFLVALLVLAAYLVVSACGGGSPRRADEPVENAGDPAGPRDPCAEIDGLIAAAPGNFLAIRGDEVPDRPPEGAAHQTTVDPPGGDCEIANLGGMNVLTCEMTGSYDEVKAQVQACVARPPYAEENGLVEWELDQDVRVSVSTDLDDAGAMHIRLYITHPDDDHEAA